MTEALSEVCPHKAQPAELAMSDKRKLRWYQLSLSTVLAVITAVAIGLGMHSSANVASFVIDLAASVVVFVACEWSMEKWRIREEAWQPEFWRSFEKAEEVCREANLPISSAPAPNPPNE